MLEVFNFKTVRSLLFFNTISRSRSFSLGTWKNFVFDSLGCLSDNTQELSRESNIESGVIRIHFNSNKLLDITKFTLNKINTETNLFNDGFPKTDSRIIIFSTELNHSSNLFDIYKINIKVYH